MRMFSAISFGVFCRCAPSTSAIMRSMNVSPGFEVMLHFDPVRQHARAARHGAAIAARLADDRRAFTSDHGLVDRRDPFDDLAVAGNDVAGLAQHDVAGAKPRSRYLLDLPVVDDLLADDFGLRLAQRVGLRLAARFGHRLGEIREQHREPQPQRRSAHRTRYCRRPWRCRGRRTPSSARRPPRRRTSPDS